jgi:N6-adenosine-specific RNA methylase IME4
MQFPRRRHSAKPPEVRDMIAAWFPDARRLEMFAREHTEGWTVWGNEVETANAGGQHER